MAGADAERLVSEHLWELQRRLFVAAIGVVITTVVAFAYAGKSLGIIRFPSFDYRQQVPKAWSVIFGKEVGMFMYGTVLGTGVLTRVEFATYPLLLCATVIFGEPMISLMVGGIFGISRGLMPLIFVLFGQIKAKDHTSLVHAMLGQKKAIRNYSGIVLGILAILLTSIVVVAL